MNKEQTQFDICIIGGGLVGSALAIVCDRLGLKTALVEKKSMALLQPNDPLDVRHIALSHGSKKIFEGLNIWQCLQKFAHAIENIHVSDQGYFGFTRLSAKAQKMPAMGYVISYHDFQKTLSQQLQTCEKVTYYTDTTLIASGLVGDIWHLTLENSTQTQIEAKLMVAADGINSLLRKSYQVETIEKSYEQTAIVTTLKVSQPNGMTAYERFTQDGPMAILPAGDDYCAFIWTVQNEKAQAYLQQNDEAFLKTAQTAFGYRVGQFLQVGKRQSFPLKLLVCDEQVRERLLFLGNAVHNLHPIAAQGFNLALRDIAGLADILKSHRDDIGAKAVLDEYAMARKQDQKRTIRFTDGLILLFSNKFLPLVKLRNTLMILFDLYPAGKSWLGKYGAGRLGKLSTLAKGESL